MRKDLVIVDDFYNNPLEVREAALNMEFSESGNYPGLRTEPLVNQGTKDAIQECLGERITEWHSSGRFQLCTSMERSWIHADAFNTWASLVFLTPSPPLGSGTSFYRHKDTGTYQEVEGIEGYHFSDPSKWELTDKVANVFNRLIIFRGDLWHMSDPYFGNTKENARLFQLFFMS